MVIEKHNFNKNVENIYMIFLGEITFKSGEFYYHTVLGISKIGDNTFEKDYVFLSVEEKEKLKRLRGKQIYNFLVGRFAVKNIVQHILNLNQKECSKFSVKNRSNGKPYISGEGFQQMKVSISHSGKYGLAIVSSNNITIGVDLEKKIIGMKEKKRFINEGNINIEYAVDASLDFQDDEIYTIIWSAKEALLKCLETGVINNMASYDVLNVHICKGYVWGIFKNYPFYKFLGFEYNNYMVSIVYPGDMELYYFNKIL